MKTSFFTPVLFFLLIIPVFSFQYPEQNKLYQKWQNLETLYQKAITDAIIADSTEICDSLWAIEMDNHRLLWKNFEGIPHVLMACFTRFPDSYKDSTSLNKWGVLWVFVPQQFKQRMLSGLSGNTDTLLRFKQLLGLPPDNKNSHIAEIWVNPDDLFRPSADPEINDNVAELFLRPSADSMHTDWFLKNIYDTYFSKNIHYPWTRLGYTYDWAENVPETGLSEYCVKKGALLHVNKVSLATRYLKK